MLVGESVEERLHAFKVDAKDEEVVIVRKRELPLSCNYKIIEKDDVIRSAFLALDVTDYDVDGL